MENFRHSAFSYFVDNGRVTAGEYFTILLDIIDDLYGMAVSDCMRQQFVRVDDSMLQIEGFFVRLFQSFDLGVPSGVELFCWVGIEFTDIDWVIPKNPKWSGKKLSLHFDDDIALKDVSDSVLLLFGESAAKDFRLLVEFLRPHYESLEDCVVDVLKNRHGHHISRGFSLWVLQSKLIL
jgi:hypothetical protein